MNQKHPYLLLLGITLLALSCQPSSPPASDPSGSDSTATAEVVNTDTLPAADVSIDSAITLADIELKGEVPSAFTDALAKFLHAAATMDSAQFVSFYHTSREVGDPTLLMQQLSRKEYSDANNEVTYTAYRCEEGDCSPCDAEAQLDSSDEIYIFTHSSRGVMSEAVEPGEEDMYGESMAFYYFVKTLEGYQLYCTFYAG